MIRLRHARRGHYFDSLHGNIWRTSQLFRTEQEALDARDDNELTWEVAIVRCKQCDLPSPVGKGLTTEVSSFCSRCDKESQVEQEDIIWTEFRRAQDVTHICGQGLIEEVVP